MPLFQMIAKNVGIRRARGEFILATNIDLLFSDELFKFFAQRKLRDNHMYRIDRWDVTEDVPVSCSVMEQLAFCRKNLLRVNRRNGSYNFATRTLARVYPDSRRVLGSLVVNFVRRHPFLSARSRYELERDWRRINLERIRPRLHTNACGDFTMLSKNNWHQLRGYPELELFSFHIDSLFCHAAVAFGIAEAELKSPMRIYHIEHSQGSGFTPEHQEILWQRIKRSRVGRLDDDQVYELILGLNTGALYPIFNDRSWGLAASKLEESTP
jgi:hypothetical protein